MDYSLLQWTILIAITLVGAIAHSTIGIGFALITVPVFLLVVDVDIAIQLAMLLTMAITIIMIFIVYKDIPRFTVRNLLIGSVVGFPLGLFLFAIATPGLIKVVVAISILVALLATYINKRIESEGKTALNDTVFNGVIAGVISGAMVTSIAMAGPAIAIYVNAVGFSKSKIRATVFSVFLVSYACAIAMHAGFHGFSAEATKIFVYLLPVSLTGMCLGHWLAGQISESVFNRMLNYTLVSVAIYLIYAAV